MHLIAKHTSFKASIAPRRLATAFCKDNTLGPNNFKDVTPADAGIKGYDGYKFSFKWVPQNETCSDSCIEMFSGFLNSSVCSYDSHTMSVSGSQKWPCGTASFDFSDGKSTPPRNPDGTTYVDQGNLACGTEQDMGNPDHFVSLDTMNNAIEYFCAKYLFFSGIRFQPGNVPDKDKFVQYTYNPSGKDSVYLSVDWTNNPTCPTTDTLTPAGVDACRDRLGTIVNDCKLVIFSIS